MPGAGTADAEPLPGRDLAAFVAAVESGTVQGAADALQLTQSGATKRLQSLERRLGVPLLERGRRGVTPTAAGQRLYPTAKDALAVLARAEHAVAAEALPLRLAASHTIGEVLLPGWLGRFASTAPDVAPELVVVNSHEVAQRVRTGAADLGFVEGRADDRGFTALLVAHDEIVAVTAAGHPWSRRRAIPSARLASERYLTRERGSGTREIAESVLTAHGVTLHPALEAASAESLKRAVRGGGFTLLSRLAIETEIRHGDLAAVPIANVDLRRDLRAIRRRRPALFGPARQLWRWLEQQVAPEP
jgi:DNA-binding transcriptional LysR family regulator